VQMLFEAISIIRPWNRCVTDLLRTAHFPATN